MKPRENAFESDGWRTSSALCSWDQWLASVRVTWVGQQGPLWSGHLGGSVPPGLTNRASSPVLLGQIIPDTVMKPWPRTKVLL